MDKSILYEQVQINLGKHPDTVWTDFAKRFLNEVYENDRDIYKEDTADLYKAIFEDSPVFESYELNENRARDMPVPTGTPAGRPGYISRARAAGIKEPEEIVGLGAKLKALIAGLGGGIKKYFSNGVAGVLANPLPLIAAGAGAGAIIALVRKFKKLSDEKKKKALLALPKDQREKAVATLSKPEDVLKKELEKKD